MITLVWKVKTLNKYRTGTYFLSPLVALAACNLFTVDHSLLIFISKINTLFALFVCWLVKHVNNNSGEHCNSKRSYTDQELRQQSCFCHEHSNLNLAIAPYQILDALAKHLMPAHKTETNWKRNPRLSFIQVWRSGWNLPFLFFSFHRFIINFFLNWT